MHYVYSAYHESSPFLHLPIYFTSLKETLQHYKIVATLALGLRPRQGVARLRAKRKTRESHHMLPGVQRVWVWGNEPSHSQVNSHVGNWSPKWTFESSERDCKGQNPLLQRIIYIIGNLLKCTCLKWAFIAHLDIWNTSYGQKKNQESNC
jgi:hypothetical protein